MMNIWILWVTAIGYTSFAQEQCLPGGRQIFIFEHDDEAYTARIWFFDETPIMHEIVPDPAEPYPSTGFENRIGRDFSSVAGMYLDDAGISDIGNYSVAISFISTPLSIAGPIHLMVTSDSKLATSEIRNNYCMTIPNNTKCYTDQVLDSESVTVNVTGACIPTPTITFNVYDNPLNCEPSFHCTKNMAKGAEFTITVTVTDAIIDTSVMFPAGGTYSINAAAHGRADTTCLSDIICETSPFTIAIWPRNFINLSNHVKEANTVKSFKARIKKAYLSLY